MVGVCAQVRVKVRVRVRIRVTAGRSTLKRYAKPD